MLMLTSFNYNHNSKSSTLDVILPGSSHGLDSVFLQKLFNCSKENGNSTLIFNYPYFERGEANSSGEDLIEELGLLNNLFNYLKCEKYKKIRLIGKSLGGIVASRFLENLSEEDSRRYEIVILGYVTGEVNLNTFTGSIYVIQGEKDKYGGIDVVKEDLKNAVSSNIQCFEIKGADHSYRDPLTKSPDYEDEVIKCCISTIFRNL